MGSKSSNKPLAPHEWRAKLGRKKTGPLSEIAVRKLLAEKSLKADVWFQKGNSPYRSADEVRELFRRLDRDGLYIKNNEVIEGPYTPAMLFKRLNEVGAGAADWLGWRAADGTWLGIKEIIQAFDDTHVENSIAARDLLLDKEKDFDTGDSTPNSTASSFGPSSLEILELDDLGSGVEPSASGLARDFLRPETLSIQRESKRNTDSEGIDSFAKGRAEAETKGESNSSGKEELFSLLSRLDDQYQENLSTSTPTSRFSTSEKNPAVAEQPRRRKIRTGGKRGMLCLDCGKKINARTGTCDHCRAEIERENAETASEKRSGPASRRPARVSKKDFDSFQLHELGKLVALSAAFATSGVFFSKGLVGAILWRTMHSSQQQSFGWFAFVISLILFGSALFTVQKEFSDGQHGKLKKLGVASLLVASTISYFVFSDRFRTMDAELNEQVVMWTKIMENGGYQQEILNEDQEQSVNAVLDSGYGSNPQQREESDPELELNRRMESYRSGVIPPD